MSQICHSSETELEFTALRFPQGGIQPTWREHAQAPRRITYARSIRGHRDRESGSSSTTTHRAHHAEWQPTASLPTVYQVPAGDEESKDRSIEAGRGFFGGRGL